MKQAGVYLFSDRAATYISVVTGPASLNISFVFLGTCTTYWHHRSWPLLVFVHNLILSMLTMVSHGSVTFTDSLQYADGDVIIQTSKHASGTMVVHSQVLSKCSKYFRAMLNGCGWSKSTTIRNLDGTRRMIWNLQMFFDRESKLCLLTDRVRQTSDTSYHNPSTDSAQPERINDDRDINFPLLELSEQDDIKVPPFTYIRNWKMEINSARSKQPRKTFLCHEAQPASYIEVYYDDSHLPPDPRSLFIASRPIHESTYEPYFEAYKKMIPDIGSWIWSDCWILRRPRYPMSYRTHTQARSYAEKVWKAFITLLYGKDIVLDSSHGFAFGARFIATLVTYADYYGALDVISPRIERLILQIPSIWQFVSEQPSYFALLGYWIKSTRIFVDAVKHLAGTGITSVGDLRTEVLGGPILEGWPLEVTAFVYTAQEQLREQLGALKRDTIHISRWDLRLPYHLRPSEDVLSDDELYKYQDVTKLLILEYFAEYAMRGCPSDALCGPTQRSSLCDETGIPGPSCTNLIRQLQRKLDTETGIQEIIATLLSRAETHDIDQELIKLHVDNGVRVVAKVFRKSALFGHDHHCCEELFPGVRESEIWGQPGTNHRHCLECLWDCRKCQVAEYESPDHFTYIQICPNWSVSQPWQGGWQYRELNETHETAPASKEYLQSLGLEWCTFTSNREMKGNM